MFLFKNKKLVITFFIVAIIVFWGSISVQASTNILKSENVVEIGTQALTAGANAGFSGDITIGDVVGYVIKGFIALLGIIFVFLLVLDGYKWMMAGGDEEKVREAKDGIMRAVIGIIIVVSAYAITYFVFTNLPGSGSGIEMNQK